MSKTTIENRSRPHVLLMVETSMAFGRSVLEGISRYLVENPGWSVQLDLRELLVAPPKWLREWSGDGIITRSTTPPMADAIRQWGIPTVNLTDIYGEQGLPAVLNNHDQVGRMGAMHLLQKALPNYAFCGFSDHHWSVLRQIGFQAELEQAGFAAHTHESDWSRSRNVGWGAQQSELVGWLESLPKPVGIMACNDFRGQHILEACGALDVIVPDEVAVLGVDNDHVLCDFCNPPLSSIIPAAERIGYESAVMLDQLMNGTTLKNQTVLIDPIGVAERQSTDVLAIADADIVAALKLIRQRACSGLTVNELLRAIPISRSAMERKFRKFVGRSPQSEIRDFQIKRAKQLLIGTDLSLNQIAPLVGFKHPEYFSVVFKRIVGQSPGRFRTDTR